MFEDLELLPRPVQQPHPPIWLAASITPESFERNGALGRPLMVVSAHRTGLSRWRHFGISPRTPIEQPATKANPDLGIFMTHIGDEDTPAYRQDMQAAIANFRAVAEIPERKMRGERDRNSTSTSKTFSRT